MDNNCFARHPNYPYNFVSVCSGLKSSLCDEATARINSSVSDTISIKQQPTQRDKKKTGVS